MSMDLAKREDMIGSISTITWGLIVIDESHLLTGQRKALFDRLINGKVARRALLLTRLATHLDDDLITRIG